MGKYFIKGEHLDGRQFAKNVQTENIAHLVRKLLSFGWHGIEYRAAEESYKSGNLKNVPLGK